MEKFLQDLKEYKHLKAMGASSETIAKVIEISRKYPIKPN